MLLLTFLSGVDPVLEVKSVVFHLFLGDIFFLGLTRPPFLNRRLLWNRSSSPRVFYPCTEHSERHYYFKTSSGDF
jgi:hypothetical protein